MVDVPLPNHVVIRRRDGRREVLLHRSLALISETKVEIKAARGALLLPLFGLVLAGGASTWLILQQGSAPLWLLVVVLVLCLFLVPVSMMGVVGAVAGADVVVDATKGSATWQQGYLGMGIGTRELVPFAKIDHLELTVEGDEADRWQGESDALRQFTLWLVKKSGKRLKLAHVPVPAYSQADGMDRTLAVGHAVAALTGAEVRLPAGWELVEVDTETMEPVVPATPAPTATRRRTRGRRA
ncbi:MAG: hypothetical protein IT304_03785 [Dehalococcoidia bacterium]|nr:hypothetical protein [Dehalococcoidia bacterium]